MPNPIGFMFDKPQQTLNGAEPVASEKTLIAIHNVLKTSSIARHSSSHLETSIDKLRESSVSYNEKTMRWHDDQTKMMVKGTDPRVADALKSKEKDTEKFPFLVLYGL